MVDLYRQLEFSPKSVSDLERMANFYRAASQAVCAGAMRELDEAFQMLVGYPHIGRKNPKHEKVREYVAIFGKGSFVIRYWVKKAKIGIIHIWHSLENEHRHFC